MDTGAHVETIEVFDQLLRAVLPIQFEIRNGVTVKDRLRLDGVQAPRTEAVPQFDQTLRDAVLEANVFVKSRCLRVVS